MTQISEHPLRYALANEMHARPFPSVQAPARAAFLAIKAPSDAERRDRQLDREHLIALLDRFGADHPAPDATHYYGQLGKTWLKWEQHTEFVTYTAFQDGVGERGFDVADYDFFPQDWLEAAPGVRLTSALIRVEQKRDSDHVNECLKEWFVPESLAASQVLDNNAVIAGDFRIDHSGNLRFAVFVTPGTGPRRIGRIMQRLTEIETYKTMSMLGLARARDLGSALNDLDTRLAGLTAALRQPQAGAEATLHDLLAASAELEQLTAQSAFRFAATRAYATIVSQRIEVLREDRIEGRQSFHEFMMRRFEPSMRTVEATGQRLRGLSERAIRIGDLLRTRVDVERQGQNQKLLESMDRRADLQLKLQKTVEGLSVVAISYYAINLALYVLAPFASGWGMSKAVLGALVAPVVILGVYLMVRRIRSHADE